MSDWQPMETVPKDGRLILVGSPVERNHMDGGRWYQEIVWSDTDALRGMGAWWPHGSGAFTHWMPLPEPPTP